MSSTIEKFSPYDSADYLVDFGDAADYLEAASEHGDDPALIAQALGTIARSGNLGVSRLSLSTGIGSGAEAGTSTRGS